MGEALNITKKAVNSTLGTSLFRSIDEILIGGSQTFTASGTFTVPPGVTKIYVTACGGGAGGSSATDSISGNGGGGGDYIFKKPYWVTPNETIQITVGKGGISNTSGESTIIGRLVVLPGGVSSYVKENGGNGGLGGSSISYPFRGGDTPYGKGGGVNRNTDSGGGGGASLGNGGNGRSNNEQGIALGYGGGGGGGFKRSARPYVEGGSGGNGIVIIEW